MNQRGMTLIGVVVGSGVIALLIWAAVEMVYSNSNAYRHTVLQEQWEAIRHSVIQTVSCPQSLPANAMGEVTAAGRIELRDQDSNLVILREGSKFGQWTVRAVREGGRVRVQAAVLRDGKRAGDHGDDDFEVDPMTRQKLSWDGPLGELYPKTGLCQGWLASPRLKILSGTIVVQANGPWKTFIRTPFPPETATCTMGQVGRPAPPSGPPEETRILCICEGLKTTPAGVEFWGNFSFMPEKWRPTCPINYAIFGELPRS